MVDEAFEQISQAATLSAQVIIRIVMYNALKHVVLDKIRTAMPGETVNKHVDQNVEAHKNAKAL